MVSNDIYTEDKTVTFHSICTELNFPHFPSHYVNYAAI